MDGADRLNRTPPGSLEPDTPPVPSSHSGEATSPWCEQLGGTLTEVWTRLVRGVTDRRAATRHLTLASVGFDGGGEARTVVLRKADRAAGEVDVYTDSASAKVSEIALEPRVTLHVWDARPQLQIRLRCKVDILSGDSVQAIWERMSNGHRSNYGGTPRPGTPIEEPKDYLVTPHAQRLAVLRCVIAEIETLHLGSNPHRRAIFRRAAGWQGAWLAP